MKKLIFIAITTIFSLPLWASTSSSYLISQYAFKNHDYAATLSHLNIENSNFSNHKLLDKIIAAVIMEDLFIANKIANELLIKDKENQEAYIVQLV